MVIEICSPTPPLVEPTEEKEDNNEEDPESICYEQTLDSTSVDSCYYSGSEGLASPPPLNSAPSYYNLTSNPMPSYQSVFSSPTREEEPHHHSDNEDPKKEDDAEDEDEKDDEDEDEDDLADAKLQRLVREVKELVGWYEAAISGNKGSRAVRFRSALRQQMKQIRTEFPNHPKVRELEGSVKKLHQKCEELFSDEIPNDETSSEGEDDDMFFEDEENDYEEPFS